jgi:hypothetical protein
MRPACLLPVLCLLLSCQPSPDPQAILDRAIAVHGGGVLDHATVVFDFRGKHFTVTREGGLFRYERTYTDTTGAVHEVLSNDSLYRRVNGQPVPLDSAQTRSVERALNSVVYFALLPYNLGDPAVQKRTLGTAEIDGEPYFELEVTFQPDGGGRDWEDRFIYWIHRQHFTMDYLAYYYHTEETGSRFREAFNVRTVAGVRFSDYRNYTADTLGLHNLELYDAVRAAGGLQPLSEILLENIRVQPHSPASGNPSP